MIYKKFNEEAEVEEDLEIEADEDTKQAAIDLLKDLLGKLEGNADEDSSDDIDDDEEEESVEVDSETCKEAAKILVNSMSTVMESRADTKTKLEATNILNKALMRIMEEADIDETDGGLPEEAADNEADQEICSATGERYPTDVDMAADNGESKVDESAAEALLRQMLKK